MERLAMREIIEIIHRLRKGQSERRIASELGNHRATVHQYHKLARERGYLQAGAALPSGEELLAQLGEPKPPPRAPSSVEPYSALIAGWVEKHVEMRSMHRQLCRSHGFAGSYSSVRRFVLANHPKEPPEVFVRVETRPAEEAQVDFGTVGRLKDPLTGQERIAYTFVMTLSYSRHQYVEFVFDQKVATFVGCHVRAFAYFGGVVERATIDNLKAAILEHALEEPVLSVPYKRLAQHYGFVISPCRPRTPRHKGKVESGIHYVKRNLCPGVGGLCLNQANAEARRWVEEHAGRRVHGTTMRRPIEEFERMERPALAPLPEHPFELCAAREAKVHHDGYLIVEKAYYSAPPECVGKRLEVLVFERVVQLYEGVRLIFTHPRATQPGERITHPGHLPQEKAIYLQRTPEYCLARAQQIGPSCLKLAQRLLEDRPKDKRRALRSLVAMSERVCAHRIEAACQMALEVEDPTFVRVRNIINDGLDMATAAEQTSTSSSAPAQQSAVYRFSRSASDFFGGMAERWKGAA